MRARPMKTEAALPLLALPELQAKRLERAELLERINRAGLNSHTATRLRPRLNRVTADIAATERKLGLGRLS